MNICIAHIQGGEISGSIDESIRHAVSKFAHYHFAATQRAADYIVQMGELPETVFNVGCPSSDLARLNSTPLSAEAVNRTGIGARIDVDKPYMLVIYHPASEVPTWQVVVSQVVLWGTAVLGLYALRYLLNANLVAYAERFQIRRWLKSSIVNRQS
jgi:UDP-N-acetylglucosamine 2-epimerase